MIKFLWFKKDYIFTLEDKLRTNLSSFLNKEIIIREVYENHISFIDEEKNKYYYIWKKRIKNIILIIELNKKNTLIFGNRKKIKNE